MSTKDQKPAFSETLDPPTAPVALCFTLSLYFLLIQNPNTPLALAIKLANGALQTSSAFNCIKSPRPSPAALFFASKAIIKGFKFSKRLIPCSAAKGPSFCPVAIRNLRFCVAVANLIRYANRPFYADVSMGLWFCNCGCKFGKNLVRVLDVFLGVRMDEVSRRSVDALGVLFKAAVVVSVIRERVGKNNYVFLRVGGLRCGFCLQYRRSCFDRFCVENRVPCYEVLDFGDGDESGGDLEVSLSELLSLSIPMEELDSPNALQRL